MTRANPGYHHVQVGDVAVTALNDGQFDAEIGWVNGVSAEESEALLRDSFRVLPPRITVSCFLLEFAGKRVLVDAGTGSAYGHVLGAAPRRLAALGVAPESIDAVLITHLHVDHVHGLLDEAGAARYPNAELVLHAAEAGFWLNKDVQAQAPEAAQEYFGHAQRSVAPYAGRIRHVTDGQDGVAGVTAVHLPGHTPGHTGWMLASAGAALLIWGDVVHIPGIQFARPEAAMAFDIDADLGRQSRTRALDMVAADKLLLAGMHLDFPTFGHVRRVGTGYGFEPMVWAPMGTGLFPAP